MIETISSNFDYVVIDGEAGIEQVNRRVMERVSHLLLVSDQSAKGLAVAGSILDVAHGVVRYGQCGLIVNRVRAGEKPSISGPPEVPLLGFLPEDDAIRSYDIDGRSFLDLPECPARNSLRRCVAGFVLFPLRDDNRTRGGRA